MPVDAQLARIIAPIGIVASSLSLCGLNSTTECWNRRTIRDTIQSIHGGSTEAHIHTQTYTHIMRLT